jgi:hypothetical protein
MCDKSSYLQKHKTYLSTSFRLSTATACSQLRHHETNDAVIDLGCQQTKSRRRAHTHQGGTTTAVVKQAIRSLGVKLRVRFIYVLHSI